MLDNAKVLHNDAFGFLFVCVYINMERKRGRHYRDRNDLIFDILLTRSRNIIDSSPGGSKKMLWDL